MDQQSDFRNAALERPRRERHEDRPPVVAFDPHFPTYRPAAEPTPGAPPHEAGFWTDFDDGDSF
jgi:hypothetical protein